jgi:photosystem II stability/assembly factor-like uncharacterized protein
MRKKLSLFGLVLMIACAAGLTQEKSKISFDKNLYKAMPWRSIGPYRGGRSIAVAGHPDQPYTFYFGSTGGGVWKSSDGGMMWTNVSDGFFKTGAVGAIAVAASDPNVIYAGMGETCIRGNMSYGDGVYRSLDAGKTWTNMGLKETQFIGRMAIHPKNPDLVYVAAMGQIFGTNKERGVFRSTDGGHSWKNILFKDERTGAVDILIDPNNSRVIYAALWEAYRNPWGMSSGGPGSGLYKSTDGGDSWTDITRNPGMPKGLVGKIGIAVSPVQADRVWAIVENENGGVFRSDDAGQTWQRVNDERSLRQRAWYFSEIYADTKNPETVYVLNVEFHKSMDGGKTFKTVSSHHGDYHDLWIDPNNSERMVIGNDGGAEVTYNGGKTWTEESQATAQFYHVVADNQFPYHLYGAQQDNSTIEITSRTSGAGIGSKDWHASAGGESGYVVVNPEKPYITYGGSYQGYFTKLNYKTDQEKNIDVWPDNGIGSGAEALKYRFQWTYPIMISPHDPNVIYAAAQCVFRSTNDGMSWETISPDLTRNDTTKQKSSGGPITKDNTSVEYYNTIFSLAESPVQKGVLWAGSDDGLVHVSRDNGATWQNVTPKELPESLVSIIEASPFDAGTAYAAVTRYKLNDFHPYLFKTADFGKSWTKITNGLPDNDYTRVIREDPNRKGLLYAGTETGVYVSWNGGDSWQSLQLNLPVVPIHDLIVHEKDLIAATHGRSFWILDDLTPLHQLSDDVAKSETMLFKPRDVYRTEGFQFRRPGLALGENPANGAVIYYYFKEKPKDEVKLEFLDEKGKAITSYSSKKDKKGKAVGESAEFYEKPKEKRMDMVPADTGQNRFVWDLRDSDAVEVPGAVFWGGDLRGPRAVPGNYQVRLSVGKFSQTQPFEIKKDPRVEATQEDLKMQRDLLTAIHRKISETHQAINSIRDIQKQISDLTAKIKDTTAAKRIKDFAKPLLDSLTAIENELIQTKAKSDEDVLNFPIKLNNKLVSLFSNVASADSRPTKQSYDVFDLLSGKVEAKLGKFKSILREQLPVFNSRVKEQDIPAVLLENK